MDLHILRDFRVEYDVCGCQVVGLDTRGVAQCEWPVSQWSAQRFPNAARACMSNIERSGSASADVKSGMLT